MREHFYLLRVRRANGEVARMPFPYGDGAEASTLAKVKRIARERAAKGDELMVIENRVSDDPADEGELLNLETLPDIQDAPQHDPDHDVLDAPRNGAVAQPKARPVASKLGDPVAFVNALDPDVLEKRIADLDGERQALEVLLAAAKARRGRCGA